MKYVDPKWLATCIELYILKWTRSKSCICLCTTPSRNLTLYCLFLTCRWQKLRSCKSKVSMRMDINWSCFILCLFIWLWHKCHKLTLLNYIVASIANILWLHIVVTLNSYRSRFSINFAIMWPDLLNSIKCQI